MFVAIQCSRKSGLGVLIVLLDIALYDIWWLLKEPLVCFIKSNSLRVVFSLTFKQCFYPRKPRRNNIKLQAYHRKQKRLFEEPPNIKESHGQSANNSCLAKDVISNEHIYRFMISSLQRITLPICIRCALSEN